MKRCLLFALFSVASSPWPLYVKMGCSPFLSVDGYKNPHRNVKGMGEGQWCLRSLAGCLMSPNGLPGCQSCLGVLSKPLGGLLGMQQKVGSVLCLVE